MIKVAWHGKGVIGSSLQLSVRFIDTMPLRQRREMRIEKQVCRSRSNFPNKTVTAAVDQAPPVY